ncbi:hypothetical protein ACP4OV_003363 [Aristida adscensionis]
MDAGGAPPPAAAAANLSLVPVFAAPAGVRVENCYVFKSRLQEYAQKAGLPTPEYSTLKEGPSHEPLFRSTVVVNNTKYESLPGFFSRKAAEQSAAEVALMEIVKSGPANESIPAVQETGLCKNLLQEYAQKMNYAIPSYICTKQASAGAPFICTVEIGGIQYIGAAARTKKEAEIKAARTALLAIQGRSEGCTNGSTQYIVVPGQRPVKESEKKPTETPKPLKVKKCGYKNKWNKRKFMRKTSPTVDAENEARVDGDDQGSDVPMQITETGEPSSDTIILHPGEEARREEHEPSRDTTIIQPEVLNVIQEPLSNAAMLQPGIEDKVVELEPLTETAMAQPIQEPLSNAAMLQPGIEDKVVELEPPTETAMVQPNSEAISMKHELLGNAEMLKPNEEAGTISQESLHASVELQLNGEAAGVKEEPPCDTAVLQTKDETRTI